MSGDDAAAPELTERAAPAAGGRRRERGPDARARVRQDDRADRAVPRRARRRRNGRPDAARRAGRPDVHREGRAGAPQADPAGCHRRLAGASGDDVGHWRSVLRGLEAAPVGTFHEYCAVLAPPPRPRRRDRPRFPGPRRPARRHGPRRGADPLRPRLARRPEPRPDRAGRRVRPPLGPRGARPSWSWVTGRGELARLGRAVRRRGRRGLARRSGSARGGPRWSASSWTGRRACEHLLASERMPAPRDEPAPARPSRRASATSRAAPTRLASSPRSCENAKVQGGGKPEHWPSPEVYEQVKDRL